MSERMNGNKLRERERFIKRDMTVNEKETERG